MTNPLYVRGLEVGVTSLAGLIAGAMSYITLIEAPARAKLSPSEQLLHWRTSFIPAAAFFKPIGMAMVPALAACAHVTGKHLYYAAAIPFGALGPFTSLAIASTNQALLESDAPASKAAEDKITTLVSVWATRHAVRVLMVVSGFGMAMGACALVTTG